MLYICDIILTDKQKTFIMALINMYGGEELPFCDDQTFEAFTIDSIKDLAYLPEVRENLSSRHTEILIEVRQLMEDPKSHYDVEDNSLWDYDGSLCQSPNTIGLKVRDVSNGLVFFYEKMGFVAYGISNFDGKTFKPHVRK
jgi:hypothetical protein